MMEGGGHRRREAWGAFLFRSAALRYTKGPHASGFTKGILIVAQEKE